MAPVIQSKAQPKFGHAALLFAGDADVPADDNVFSLWFKPLHMKVLGAAVAALVFGAITVSQMPDLTQHVTLFEESEQPVAKIAMVRESSGEGELVGTLIHAQDSPTHYAKIKQSKPVTLDAKERERLLQIISN